MRIIIINICKNNTASLIFKLRAHNVPNIAVSQGFVRSAGLNGSGRVVPTAAWATPIPAPRARSCSPPAQHPNCRWWQSRWRRPSRCAGCNKWWFDAKCLLGGLLDGWMDCVSSQTSFGCVGCVCCLLCLSCGLFGGSLDEMSDS